MFSLQFLILISRQNYRLQISNVTPCGWVTLVWKIEKTKREEKGLIIESDDSDSDVDGNENPLLVFPRG